MDNLLKTVVFLAAFQHLQVQKCVYYFYLLFFREDSPPKIMNSDCDDCPLCRSRSSNLKDSCSNINTLHGDSFYALVVAHKVCVFCENPRPRNERQNPCYLFLWNDMSGKMLAYSFLSFLVSFKRNVEWLNKTLEVLIFSCAFLV